MLRLPLSAVCANPLHTGSRKNRNKAALDILFSSFMMFVYGFLNWDDWKYAAKCHDDQNGTCQRAHCYGPFFPTGEIMVITCRHVMHRHKRVQQGRGND